MEIMDFFDVMMSKYDTNWTDKLLVCPLYNLTHNECPCFTNAITCVMFSSVEVCTFGSKVFFLSLVSHTFHVVWHATKVEL